MTKYRIILVDAEGNEKTIEDNIEKSALEKYIREYLSFDELEFWFEDNYGFRFSKGYYPISHLEYEINDCITNLAEEITKPQTEYIGLGWGLFMERYEQED